MFCISHAAILLVFHAGENARVVPQYPSQIGEAYPGPGLLVFLMLLTELNSFFHELWGNALGFRKVSPTVSPRKTYGGLIGGILSTILVAVIVGPPLTLLDIPRSLIAGLLIGMAGFAGDLCVSALKRDLKIENFGSTLPGAWRCAGPNRFFDLYGAIVLSLCLLLLRMTNKILRMMFLCIGGSSTNDHCVGDQHPSSRIASGTRSGHHRCQSQ